MFNILQEPVGLLLARVFALLLAIPVHEVAHAWVSDKLGDHTARDLGRLTLNPIKHIDPWGLAAMLTIGIGWAKPVPVNPGKYKNPKSGMAITAAAGPLSNLLLAYVFYIFFKVFSYGFVMYNMNVVTLMDIPEWVSIVADVLYYFTIINVNLAIFNMLPIPPFDGSRIFGLILPNKLYFSIQKYEKYVMIGVLLLMFVIPTVTSYNPLGWLLSRANNAVMQGIDWATGFVDAFFASRLV